MILEAGKVAIDSACCCTQDLTIASVSPSFGPRTDNVPAAGRPTITIRGTGFVDAAHLVVSFGVAQNVASGEITFISDTEIRVKPPAYDQTATVNVRVTRTTDHQSATKNNGYSYIKGCGVFTPTNGPTIGGNNVQIEANTSGGTGHYLDGISGVRFNASLATGLVINNDNKLHCNAPVGSGTIPVQIEYSNGIICRKLSAYTYSNTADPLSPNSGPPAGNTLVTITGNGWFGGTTTVKFAGTNATSVTVVNSTTITCRTPAHAAGTVDVQITSNGITQTLTGAFTYIGAPPTEVEIYINGVAWHSIPGGNRTRFTHNFSIRATQGNLSYTGPLTLDCLHKHDVSVPYYDGFALTLYYYSGGSISAFAQIDLPSYGTTLCYQQNPPFNANQTIVPRTIQMTNGTANFTVYAWSNLIGGANDSLLGSWWIVVKDNNGTQIPLAAGWGYGGYIPFAN